MACAAALAGCGEDDNAAVTTSSSTTSGSGGAGGDGGAGGSGGGEAFCPTGSHPGANGCEATLTAWNAGPLLNHSRDHHATFIAETASGPYLYALAGTGPTLPRLQIERGAIDDSGNVSEMSDVADLPIALIGPGFCQVGAGFVLGGGLLSDGNAGKKSYVGAVDDAGGVTISEGPDLNASRYHVALACARGFVFALGGLDQDVSTGTPKQTIVDVIERAPFDGTTLSAWETIAPLPEALTHHAAVVHDDAIYVIGGGSGVSAHTTIYRANVAENGDLGAWETVGDLPEGRATSSALVFLNQLYVVGGMTSLVGGEQDTVLRANLDDTGKVGTFEALTALPMARAHSHQTPLFQGHLYSVGGSIEHAPQREIFVGTLE